MGEEEEEEAKQAKVWNFGFLVWKLNLSMDLWNFKGFVWNSRKDYEFQT